MTIGEIQTRMDKRWYLGHVHWSPAHLIEYQHLYAQMTAVTGHDPYYLACHNQKQASLDTCRQLFLVESLP